MVSLLRKIGFQGDGPPTKKGEVHDRIHAELSRLGEERVEYLAAFAGLLARAAFGDLEISEEEERAMKDCLRKTAGLEDKDAELVAHIARNATEALAGVEDYLLTRTCNDRATPQEKEVLLDCMYEVAAADGTVSNAEDEEIKQIGSALMIQHARMMDVRAKYRDKLSILRNLPS
ncbi:MAG: TerB family tellurite resistance protein [Candidatus Binatia bacterium]|nr:TerB family tellurite resistance protein [Candidatus Binatia bacterium]